MCQFFVGLQYPARNDGDPSFSSWALFLNVSIVLIGICAFALWSLAGELSTREQNTRSKMHALVRESPFLRHLLASLILGYGIQYAFFGSAVFYYVLDQALCYILLLSSVLMEVLSGLHLMPGVRWGDKSIPALDPRALAWVWYLVRLFAFQASLVTLVVPVVVCYS